MARTYEQYVEEIGKLDKDEIQRRLAAGEWRTHRVRKIAQGIFSGEIDPKEVKAEADKKAKAEEKRQEAVSKQEETIAKEKRKLDTMLAKVLMDHEEAKVQTPAERVADKANDDKADKNSQTAKAKTEAVKDHLNKTTKDTK